MEWGKDIEGQHGGYRAYLFGGGQLEKSERTTRLQWSGRGQLGRDSFVFSPPWGALRCEKRKKGGKGSPREGRDVTLHSSTIGREGIIIIIGDEGILTAVATNCCQALTNWRTGSLGSRTGVAAFLPPLKHVPPPRKSGRLPIRIPYLRYLTRPATTEARSSPPKVRKTTHKDSLPYLRYLTRPPSSNYTPLESVSLHTEFSSSN